MSNDTKGTQPQRPHFVEAFYNWLSLFGIAVLTVACAMGIVLGLADALARVEIAYIGVAYLLIGGTAAAGALAAVLGALRVLVLTRRGVLTLGPTHLTVDLSQQRDRLVAFGALVGAIVALSGVGTGAYQGVHYMESNEFCTGACHTAMRPEAVAHQGSPHAKVDCVACHVGEGAGSFVQAKLNGVRQLVGVITGDYARPIATPIHNLRPARETCENCHWRARWVGDKQKTHTYYSGEPDNAMSTVRLLLKVGGSQPGQMAGEGIHYHMSIGRTVEFSAADEDRQEVTWVRVTQPNGKVDVYAKGDASAPPPEKIRIMDCIDCHNRPAHRYDAPMDSMNDYLSVGRIDATLPSIKRKGVEVLAAEYPDTDTAKERIASTLRAFYDQAEPHPKTESVDTAIAAIQEIYGNNFFPEMGVRWSAYPDNSSHKDSAGCFRCHNDSLVNAAGKPIFSACNKCHVLLAQSPAPPAEDAGAAAAAPAGSAGFDYAVGLNYFHGADEQVLTEYTNCALCHSGGPDIY